MISSSGHRTLRAIILIGSLIGFGINLWLLAVRIAGGGDDIAGCGGGSCGELLTSRWAVVFWTPITLLGSLVYGVLIASIIAKEDRWELPLLGLIGGAAFWFIFVQAVMIRKFCPWCMAAHTVGLGLLALGLIRNGLWTGLKQAFPWGFVGGLGIALAQLYGPVPAGYRIEKPGVVPAQASVHTRGAGPQISFDGGKKSFAIEGLPRLGSPTAKRVMVEYFDYQCTACLTMAGYMEVLLAKHPEELAVILLPVPLDGLCNAHVLPKDEHPGSCEITRIALAVWRTKPESFSNYHSALISTPSVDSARRLALRLLSPDQLQAALNDPWIEELIQANIADQQVLSQTTAKLPKLLIRENRILHGLPSGEQDFVRVMEQELGL